MVINLDKRDTLILKGLAISAIVFHNYFHLISVVHQNEFTFYSARLAIFLQSFNDPVSAIEAIFAYFGHFGVEIFIFLSAYGLARSHWDDPAPWASFLWGRIKKLYPVCALVVLPWFLIVIMLNGPSQAFSTVGFQLLWMFAGVSNLIPGYGLPPVGPWWFIPFIVQFYALWPLMRRFTIRCGPRGLLVLSALSLGLVSLAHPTITQWSMTMLDTPIGHMPELCLGIFLARYPVPLNGWWALPAAAFLILGSLYRAFWPLTYVSALILSLVCYLWLRNVLRGSSLLVQIGQYSLLIFLLNGIVRTVFLPYSTSQLSGLFFGCVSAVASFAIAAVIQEFVAPLVLPGKFKPA